MLSFSISIPHPSAFREEPKNYSLRAKEQGIDHKNSKRTSLILIGENPPMKLECIGRTAHEERFKYHEYKGDPDNIQFLIRDKHLEAHRCCWQNPTNWNFNPETKEFVDFGENKPIPCTAINLSEPVCSPVIGSQNKANDLKEPSKAETESTVRMKPSHQEDAVHYSETNQVETALLEMADLIL